jgi:hypothetical protein
MSNVRRQKMRQATDPGAQHSRDRKTSHGLRYHQPRVRPTTRQKPPHDARIRGNLQRNRAASLNHGPSRLKCRNGSAWFSTKRRGRGASCVCMTPVYGVTQLTPVDKPVEIRCVESKELWPDRPLAVDSEFCEHPQPCRNLVNNEQLVWPPVQLSAPLLTRVAQKGKLTPNTSIERTSTGLARFTSLVHVPLRGPSQWWPAHVKR